MWLLFGTNNERVSTFFRSCVFLFPLDTATFIPKRELSSFTPEEIKQSLHKERDNLISTGTLEAIPKYEWNSIPKNKQITSHTFTEVGVRRRLLRSQRDVKKKAKKATKTLNRETRRAHLSFPLLFAFILLFSLFFSLFLSLSLSLSFCVSSSPPPH